MESTSTLPSNVKVLVKVIVEDKVRSRDASRDANARPPWAPASRMGLGSRP
jgi:hypothetical protein